MMQRALIQITDLGGGAVGIEPAFTAARDTKAGQRDDAVEPLLKPSDLRLGERGFCVAGHYAAFRWDAGRDCRAVSASSASRVRPSRGRAPLSRREMVD